MDVGCRIWLVLMGARLEMQVSGIKRGAVRSYFIEDVVNHGRTWINTSPGRYSLQMNQHGRAGWLGHLYPVVWVQQSNENLVAVKLPSALRIFK